MKPQAVLFDCDGVLVDSEPASDRVIAANLARHGLPIAPEAVHSLFLGGTIAGIGDAARAMGARLPPDWVDAIYEDSR